MFFGFGGWLYDFSCDREQFTERRVTAPVRCHRAHRPGSPVPASPVGPPSPGRIVFLVSVLHVNKCFPFLECDSFLLSIAFVKFILFVFIVTHSGLWSGSWNVLRGPLHGSDSLNYCGHDANIIYCCPSHSLKLHCGLSASQFRSVQ